MGDPTKKSDLERAFDTQFIALGQDLPRPMEEYRFALPRRFKFDRAWPAYKVAVELEGALGKSDPVRCHNCHQLVRAMKQDKTPGKVITLPGYHQRFGTFKSNVEKYNLAVKHGWFVLRFLHDDVRGSPFEMVELIRDTLDHRKHRVGQIEELSVREDQILHFIAAGLTQREIAIHLSLGVDTIRSHAQSLRQKLLAGNQAEAVARAAAWGLLDLSRIPWADENPVLYDEFHEFVDDEA
jgi:DNA-binding CsgD family transcriptional regulator